MVFKNSFLQGSLKKSRTMSKTSKRRFYLTLRPYRSQITFEIMNLITEIAEMIF